MRIHLLDGHAHKPVGTDRSPSISLLPCPLSLSVTGAFDYIQLKGVSIASKYPYPLDGTQHACATPAADAKIYKAQRSLFLVPPCLGDVCAPNPMAEATLLGKKNVTIHAEGPRRRVRFFAVSLFSLYACAHACFDILLQTFGKILHTDVQQQVRLLQFLSSLMLTQAIGKIILVVFSHQVNAQVLAGI